MKDAAKTREAQIAEMEAEGKEADERILELEAALDSKALSAMGSQMGLLGRSPGDPAQERRIQELQVRPFILPTGPASWCLVGGFGCD